MIWIVAIVILCCIVVLAQLLLSYQKRAHDLRLKQEPLRRRIRLHTNAMQEEVRRIEDTARSRLEELERDAEELKEQLTPLEVTLAELEQEVFVDGSEDENDEEELEIATLDESQVALRNVAKEAQGKQEELDGHLTNLVRDIEVVKRTLGLLESKLQRKDGGRSGKARKRNR